MIPYEKLLDQYWLHIDPTDAGGQFCDRGHAYITAIFYENEEQKRVAEQSKAALEKSGELKKPVATKIVKAGTFYPAEEYHQDYSREESHTVQILPVQLRPGQPPERTLG